MTEPLLFTTRAAFREWLDRDAGAGDGVWLLLGKPGGPTTLTAAEALEEALCFGWIDGRMKTVDAGSYVKYFAPRRPGSRWSEKNKALVGVLEQRGSMTDRGRAAVQAGQRDGGWDASRAEPLSDEQVAAVAELLRGVEPAFTNLLAMPPSVRRTYARGYLETRTDAGRERRLAWMTDRLNQNLRPM
jgi:uncharacterized protein YdeI (YjbR/CyaY-like superfamily)